MCGDLRAGFGLDLHAWNFAKVLGVFLDLGFVKFQGGRKVLERPITREGGICHLGLGENLDVNLIVRVLVLVEGESVEGGSLDCRFQICDFLANLRGEFSVIYIGIITGFERFQSRVCDSFMFGVITTRDFELCKKLVNLSGQRFVSPVRALI